MTPLLTATPALVALAAAAQPAAATGDVWYVVAVLGTVIVLVVCAFWLLAQREEVRP